MEEDDEEGDGIILDLIWVCAHVYCFGLCWLVIQSEMGMKGRES